jgi:hypothetical protein
MKKMDTHFQQNKTKLNETKEPSDAHKNTHREEVL